MSLSQLKSDSEDAPSLTVVPTPLRGKKDVEGYLVRLGAAVEPENAIKVEVEMVLINAVVPFPKEISQVLINVILCTIIHYNVCMAIGVMLNVTSFIDCIPSPPSPPSRLPPCVAMPPTE